MKFTKSSRLTPLRNFLKEYRRSRLGLAGAIIILFFIVVALFAPLLATHDPIRDQNLADPLSIPGWARAFPQYADYPVNAQMLAGTSLTSSSDLGKWNIVSRPSSNDATKGYVSYRSTSQGLLLNFTPGKASSSNFLSQLSGSQAATFVLNQTFTYPWLSPCSFGTSINLTPLKQTLNTKQLTVDIYLKSTGGKTYHVFGPPVYTDPTNPFEYYTQFSGNHSYSLSAVPKSPQTVLLATGKGSINLACGLASLIFATKGGNVTVSYVFTSSVPTMVQISGANVQIVGSAFGLMGTDTLGRDVWSQFVYGAQVSLEVGLFAALIAVVIGTAVGLVAGFYGGLVDEGLMRFNDFLLVLPFLPLILVVLEVLNLSGIGRTVNTEILILLFIGLLGWNPIARVIRSQVLSVKERQFVEASRALGARQGHIIWRHILPNVMGLVYAQVALTVPAAILTEAALTFLGFGDPSTISWGTMLSNAQSAFTSPQHSFVWWYFFPPGISIAVLSMAFVFVGFSLDSVLNPRLRQR